MSTLSPSDVRAIVIGALLALFLSALDQTIVATALPPIAADLGGFTLISWVVTAYLLTSTCVTPIVGKLSDLYGRRLILNVSLILFMLGSAFCALAPSMPLLILFRALQGLGGGGLLTVGQTVIADVVSPRERGRYAGHFAVVWGSASILGPTAGGLLTQYYGWPWIFWINIPFGLLALLIADRALRKLPTELHRSRIDLWGVAVLSVGTIAFLMLLSWRQDDSLDRALTMALAAVALIAGTLFARSQTRAAEPILPPRFLKDGSSARCSPASRSSSMRLARGQRAGAGLFPGGPWCQGQRSRAADDPHHAVEHADRQSRRPLHPPPRPLQAPAALRIAAHRRLSSSSSPSSPRISPPMAPRPY